MSRIRSYFRRRVIFRNYWAYFYSFNSITRLYLWVKKLNSSGVRKWQLYGLLFYFRIDSLLVDLGIVNELQMAIKLIYHRHVFAGLDSCKIPSSRFFQFDIISFSVVIYS